MLPDVVSKPDDILERFTDVLVNEVKGERRAEQFDTDLSLHEFCKQAWPIVESCRFVDNWHIGFIAEHLQALARGELGVNNVLCNLPPGTMKSYAFCVFWPCWTWTWWPESRWIFASFNREFSTRDSHRRLRIVLSDWYQSRWGHRVRIDRDQLKRRTWFDNTVGGEMYATSVGGGGMGRHPQFFVVDDPNNPEDIHSRSNLATFQGLRQARDKCRKIRCHRRPAASVCELSVLARGRFACGNSPLRLAGE